MATKPGERRLQILQTLAQMLEVPKGEKITTAALAGNLECSEAALYRHFASKAQMYEGLIEFIEQSLFGVINQITSEETGGFRQIELILGLLLRELQDVRLEDLHRGLGCRQLVVGHVVWVGGTGVLAHVRRDLDRLVLEHDSTLVLRIEQDFPGIGIGRNVCRVVVDLHG